MANQARTFEYGVSFWYGIVMTLTPMFDRVPNALWVLVSSHVKMRPR
jgi:hypothetical protein